MATHTTTALVRELHLARAAQVAGEAFGCDESDTGTARRRRGSLLWVGSMTSALVGLIAAAALYTGF